MADEAGVTPAPVLRIAAFFFLTTNTIFSFYKNFFYRISIKKHTKHKNKLTTINNYHKLSFYFYPSV